MRTIVLDPWNGGLALARTLVRAGESVVVLASETNAFAARTRGADGRVVAADAWADALGEGPAVVVAGTDAASQFLACERERLPAQLRMFERADDAHLPLLHKDEADAIARRAGVRVPWTRVVTTAGELAAAASEAPYPVVVKPVVSHTWRAVHGDHRVALVHEERAAVREGERGLEHGLDMLLSEYVPGGDDAVEEAIVVRAADGSYPVSFGCQKIRQYPVGFGAASLCQAAELPESTALAHAVLDQAGFVGVCGVETKRHARTGERYFIEANVRLPTQWGLGDAAGLQASRRLAAVARGEDVGPQPPMRRRARLIFPELDVRALLVALRGARGAGRAREAVRFLRSYRGVRELGVLDPRDPGPLLAYLGAAIGRRTGLRSDV